MPADPDLAGAEIELVSLPGRERLLRDALARPEFAGHSHVLIDCPPSLGLLTLNAFVAADAVLVPLQCEFFALEGLSHLVRTIERVRASLNPAITLEGILLTMLDRRNNLSDLVAADARSFFGAKVYDTVIPRNVRISEAPSHGVPVVAYDPRSAGAQAYGQLAAELLRRGAGAGVSTDEEGQGRRPWTPPKAEPLESDHLRKWGLGPAAPAGSRGRAPRLVPMSPRPQPPRLGRGLAALLGDLPPPAAPAATRPAADRPAPSRPLPAAPRRRSGAHGRAGRVDPPPGRAAAGAGAAQPHARGGFEIVAGERRWRAAQISGPA